MVLALGSTSTSSLADSALTTETPTRESRHLVAVAAELAAAWSS